MIISSFCSMEVGKIYPDIKITDAEGHVHIMPIMVLRQATYNEYLDQMAELNIPRSLYSLPRDYPYHYEISVD